MEKEYNETIIERRNPWRIIGIGLIITFLAFGLYYLYNQEAIAQKQKIYNQATIDIANITSQTGKIVYLMNISDAKSINVTTIPKLQQDFLAQCIKVRVCTWNQTKYEELNRK